MRWLLVQPRGMPADSEADAGDEGEEAERELVALGGALLVACDVAILVPRDGHRLVGRGVAHTVPAEAKAEAARRQAAAPQQNPTK